MASKSPTDLQDLIDRPNEREGLELKSWVDLTDKSSPARAGIARHLAAISNYGGGYLVFGFKDDGTRCDANADVRKSYSHDVIAGIIDRYLQPKFQCDVYFESRAGVEHAIVWVPPHGTVPVISKADGPKDRKGQPQGIRSGLVYIRSAKPESVAIATPEQWGGLIQRCVLARRDELVKMFAEIVSGGSTPTVIPGNKSEGERAKLTEFHQRTQEMFLVQIALRGGKSKVPVQKNFMQFSYAIRTHGGQRIPASELLRVIEKANGAVRDTVRYGWSMFYPFTRPEISPQFMTDDELDNGETEFVQGNLIELGETDHLDFWRLSEDGRASIARNFHEDRFSKKPSGIDENQKWFDPWLHVRELTEIVRHAHAVSEEFSEVEEVCFKCEWHGLLHRVTATSDWKRYVRPHMSQTDARAVTICFPQSEIIGNLPVVVSRLYAPVHRMFDPKFDPSPKWVSGMMQDFIVPGL